MSKGGFEPPTNGFSVHYSTTELFRRFEILKIFTL